MWRKKAQGAVAPVVLEAERRGRLRLTASPDGREGSVTIHQDVDLYAGLFKAGEGVRFALRPGRHAWIQVAQGSVTVNGETLHQGVESSLRVDWEEVVTSPLAFYTDIRYTYLPTARFTRNTLFEGNRLPYAPENILAFMVGGRHRNGVGFEVDASLVGRQFGDNN